MKKGLKSSISIIKKFKSQKTFKKLVRYKKLIVLNKNFCCINNYFFVFQNSQKKSV